MKFSVMAPLVPPICTPDYASAVARACDERGFEILWMPEHALLFDEYDSRYPYDPSGRFPIAGEGGLVDPFIGLSFAASATERLRLGTGICLVPQRQPVYTAKMAADLDVLSKGRFVFGVGVGWLREEFNALQMPFEKRGRVCREYLEVIRRLWCDPVSQFEGDYYTLPPCRQYPKPVQQPHPPIYFGGESDAALRRVADLGQGWFGYNQLPEQAGARIKKLEALLKDRGRDPREVEFATSPHGNELDADAARRFADVGIEHMILTVLAGSLDESLARLDEVANTFVAQADRF